jgi:hypothetical protein
MTDDEYVEYFLEKGIIEESGTSDITGEKLYSLTPKMKDSMPELYREHLDFVNSEIMSFWEMGFVDIDLFSEDPIVTLTDKAFIDEQVLSLPSEKQWSLYEIKRLLLK